MAVTQYIGSRYVPLFANPIEWDSDRTYEPLTIVLHDGNSYTSKQFVPKGIDISNGEFWAITGNYNAQVELYRQETQAVADDLDDIKEVMPFESFSSSNTIADSIDSVMDEVESVADVIPKSSFSSSNTVKDYIDDEIDVVEAEIESFYKDIECAEVETFYNKDLNVYMHKLTVPRTFTKKLVRRTDYAPKPYDYIRSQNDLVAVNGQLPSVTIIDGVVTDQNPSSPEFWYYLGWDSSGNPMYVSDYYQNKTSAQLVSAGFHTCFGVWGPIIKNGLPFDLYADIPNDVPNASNKNYILNRWQSANVFCWDDSYFYIYMTDGRSPNSFGVKYTDLRNWLYLQGIREAVMMDGGGSNQMWTSNPAINHVQYNYPAGSNIVDDVDYNLQGDTSRDVYSLITFKRA